MIELMCAIALGMLFGYLLKKEQQPPIVEILQNQVEKLEEDVAYYKDLCKWHVEEKIKLQKIKDQFESECG
jgi:hypothetical protein